MIKILRILKKNIKYREMKTANNVYAGFTDIKKICKLHVCKIMKNEFSILECID